MEPFKKKKGNPIIMEGYIGALTKKFGILQFLVPSIIRSYNKNSFLIGLIRDCLNKILQLNSN